jgi:electron transfer flavoprotein alpha subunit
VNKKIWVHAEVINGKITDVVFELLSKAQELATAMGYGTEIESTLIGNDLGGETRRLSEYGVKRIYMVDDFSLRMYSPETYTQILATLVTLHKPDIYLFGATSIGSALGPAVAARLKTGMAAHCIDLRVDDEKNLIALVPSFGGKIIGEILCPMCRPQMASVKPGVFVKSSPQTPLSCEINVIDQSSWKSDIPEGLKPVGIITSSSHGLPLSEADVVVCGGFGIENQKNWQLLEKLAECLSGAAACTRPVVDEGWSGEHCMVGTSGHNVRPKVYIGFGISGATHHICGMNKAGVVISVNKDESAPIFEVSDFKIVANVNEILPLLLEVIEHERLKM